MTEAECSEGASCGTVMCMKPIEKVRGAVAALYEQQLPNRDIWSEWLYDNHVLVVAKFAREVAERHGADPDTCEAVALLHDLGDALTSRHDPGHEQLSLRKAEELLHAAGYDEQTVRRLVDDALRFHSCHGAERPKSEEGKVLATADALAHFLTDFYAYMRDVVFKDRGPEAFKRWVAEKIERDYHAKIFYDHERTMVTPTYEKVKQSLK